MEICSRLSLANKSHLCWMAAACLAFFGLLRKDNIGPKSARSFDGARDPCIGDVLFVSPSVLVVVIKRSKTRRLGSQPLLIKIPRARAGDKFCPYSIIKAYVLVLLRDGGKPDSPLFQSVHAPTNRYSGQAMPHSTFVSSLKRFLRLIGIDPSQYGGHSFRRGGSTTLGVEGHQELIKPAGDWKSSIGSDVYDLSPRGMDVSVAFALLNSFNRKRSIEEPLVPFEIAESARRAAGGAIPLNAVLNAAPPVIPVARGAPVGELGEIPHPPPLPASRLRESGRLRLATSDFRE